MSDKYQARDIRQGRPGKPYGSDGWLTPEGKISPCYRFEDAVADELAEQNEPAGEHK